MLTKMDNPYGYGRVHSGFMTAYRFIARNLEKQLTFARAEFPDAELSFTGHSLGGAMAIIAASHLGEEMGLGGLYTYGAPAVGDAEFNETIPDNIEYKRVVNGRDPIVWALDGKLGYEQSGDYIQINHDDDRTVTVMTSHKTSQYMGQIEIYDHSYDLQRQAENLEKENRFLTRVVNFLKESIYSGSLARFSIAVSDITTMAKALVHSMQFITDEEGVGKWMIPEGTLWRVFTTETFIGTAENAGALAVANKSVAQTIATALAAEKGMLGFEMGLNKMVENANEEYKVLSSVADTTVAAFKTASNVITKMEELASSLGTKIETGVRTLFGDTFTDGVLSVGEWFSGKSKLLSEGMVRLSIAAQLGIIGYEEFEAATKWARANGAIEAYAEEYRRLVKDPFAQLAHKYLRGEISDSEFDDARHKAKALHDRYASSMDFLLMDRERDIKTTLTSLDVTGLHLFDAIADTLAGHTYYQDVILALNGVTPEKNDEEMKEAFIKKYGERFWYNADTRYYHNYNAAAAQLAHRLKTNTYTMSDRVFLGFEGDLQDAEPWIEANTKLGTTAYFRSDHYDSYNDDSEFGKRKQILVDDLTKKGYDVNMEMSMDELMAMEADEDDYDGESTSKLDNGLVVQIDPDEPDKWHYTYLTDPLYYFHRDYRMIYLRGYSYAELEYIRNVLGNENVLESFTRPTKRQKLSSNVSSSVRVIQLPSQANPNAEGPKNNSQGPIFSQFS
jgi:hypothetical protein